MSAVQIILTQKDYSKLKEIKPCHRGDNYKRLEEEMEHAKIIAEHDIPKDVVTMNSKVGILIIEEDKKIGLTLVYPSEADFFQNKISVLAPLGLALLGLKINQEINWKFPDGLNKTLRILDVQQLPATKVHVH